MSTESARILIVDDEMGMREGCRRALLPHGFQVDTAEHGAEGLHRLREQCYDLILLDAMMPGVSGMELLRQVRERQPDTIVVMITGYATVELATQAMKQGAHAFLPKPFTSDELLQAVSSGLEERSHRLSVQKQQAAEEEVRQLLRAREEQAKIDAIESRFMLVLVQELRNPAGAIKNHLQLMRAGYVDDDEWDEYLGKLDGRATQLLAMLDELLELTYLKEIRTTGKLQEVAVADVLEEVARRYRPIAEAKGLEFQIDIRSRPTLVAEPHHLASLWSKLIDNAVIYTPKGRVHVSLDVEGARIVGTVADTGIGIADEELGRIFQDFYRSESARALVELGTGLGLPIVYQVVSICHGGVQVESTPGEGSTFTVWLPFVKRTEA